MSKVKIIKSNVTFDCTPDTEAEGGEDKNWDDWSDVIAGIKAISMEGLQWLDFQVVPFVFGLKKLVVLCQIEDSKVPSTDPIIEEMKKVKYVDGVEMVNMEMASN
eukprot:TRINITY_DN107_c0_g3_i1.p1 TRINITY_DN107_c0_g3~~TRINITY_DN107_c0_g3_i1.p1  ORF type:complete len:105 (+),score=29.98 TRINITY_DN107_c0_g3_i1:51-365(+)